MLAEGNIYSGLPTLMELCEKTRQFRLDTDSREECLLVLGNSSQTVTHEEAM